MRYRLGKQCPILGEECRGDACAWHVTVTQDETVHKDCAISWLPTMILTGATTQRATGAAFERFRNDMVRKHREFMWKAGQRPQGPPPVDDVTIINATAIEI